MMQNTYRPDIDGLRAVAVLLVIFHHLFPAGLTGGFVGVDVFFVISGFLITTQIAAEMEAGQFSLRRFYQRRINRIVPALFTVITATLCAGLLLLSPIDLQLLARSAVSAMLGVSNIFFWKEYGSYFAHNSVEAPLLHTWSLGIEEQYYAVWPLLLLAAFKYARRHVLLLVGLALLLCFAVSEIGIKFAASASYYLLPTRFFELLLGAAVALAVSRQKLQWIGRFGYTAHIGLVLIFAAAFKLNGSSAFPGVNALAPCLGTALLIATGAAMNPNANSALRLLAAKPVVMLGLLSYSLYLWHWPIIAFLHYKNVPVNGTAVACVVALSLALSWLSWRFVETPFRRNGLKFSFTRVFARRYVLPSTCVGVFALLAISNHGLPGRFDGAVARMEIALGAKPEVLRKGCHSAPVLYSVAPDPAGCRLGAPKAAPDGLLIGDSYANHFTGMVDVMAAADGLAVMDYTMDNCPPLLGYKATNTEKCEKRIAMTLDYIKSRKFSKIILAANWPHKKQAGEKLEETVRLLLGTGAGVTLIVDNAYISQASRCPIKKLMYRSNANCSGELMEGVGYLEEIRAMHPGVKVVDPNSVICRGKICDPVAGDVLLYRDNGHLNDLGSRLIGEKLLAAGVRL